MEKHNKKTNNRVFAVIVVHCFGFPVNLERITSICKKNILIVEDAAESLGQNLKRENIKIATQVLLEMLVYFLLMGIK